MHRVNLVITVHEAESEIASVVEMHSGMAYPREQIYNDEIKTLVVGH
jgi:hypothetical protein